MSTALQVPPITTEQYERFEGYPGLKDELINGKIVLSPRPKPLHQQVAKNIGCLLDSGLLGQIYTVHYNSNIRFREANSMPAPDVFVITKEEWNRVCDEDDYLSGSPVMVVEVLSPANRKRRVEDKTALYLCQGVKEVWLVHPKKQTLEVVRASERSYVTGYTTLPSPLRGKVEVQAFFEREK